MTEISTESVAVAIIFRGQCVLVQRRTVRDALEGLWEFPGGKVEEGETPEEAVARECTEELGITVIAIERLGVVSHQYEHLKVVLHPVRCEIQKGEPRPMTPEVGECRWVERAELLEVDTPAANAPIIEWILRDLLQT